MNKYETIYKSAKLESEKSEKSDRFDKIAKFETVEKQAKLREEVPVHGLNTFKSGTLFHDDAIQTHAPPLERHVVRYEQVSVRIISSLYHRLISLRKTATFAERKDEKI